MQELPLLKHQTPGIQTIDCLGWQAGFAFRAYGVDVGVRTNFPELVDKIKKLLPLDSVFLEDGSAVDFLFSVVWDEEKQGISEFYRNAEKQICYGDFNERLDQLESHLRLTIAEFAPNLVFVHAGAVGWNEKAIIIPGSSFSGKTTSTAELVRAGAVYYSDEYAIFDENGFLLAFPKPLSIRESWAAGKQVDKHVEAIGGRQGREPLRVSGVIVTRFEAGAVWQPRQLSSGQGVLELLAHTVSARTNPQLALKILPKAVENALILQSSRGDASSVAQAVLDVFEKHERLVA